MQNCRSAIEELVIEEIKAQTASLGRAAREKINLSEVAAYALNRLPPMYATSQRGWQQQRNRARAELKQQITSNVRRALVGVRQDSLRPADPLPENEFHSQARSLAKLQEILGQDNLKWKDVPDALEAAFMTIKLKGALSYTYVSPSRRNAMDVKQYIKRSKVQNYSWKSRKSQREQATPESGSNARYAREFASYMYCASFDFVNVLENPVLAVVHRQLARLHPALIDQIKPEEVAAYTLNRLPPMYATSQRGLKEQRYRVKAELAKDIILMVREGISIVVNSPARAAAPLPFEKFGQEQESALDKIRQILHIDDINWRNVAEIVEDALERVRSGEISLHAIGRTNLEEELSSQQQSTREQWR
ncbi:Late competence development protein ComFB [Thalassoporum mexicanum PCC 7367]|uniref:late competence development ComFB family protein n=1 Tax=Thalassoporum mexicanum TaxID=3457544 RepID=UPI00029FE0CE|nr:late competence development ComFB family protein [Pseudanabaena sp. PCC 7367]AFY69510.1 Late competence development protein ComFB [Pseudanabaena sp. PCC 7367]